MQILAVKGGGVRGLLTAKLGERLERAMEGWDTGVDLFAGTSTGGIIALARAARVPWKKIVKLYRKNAGRIFGLELETIAAGSVLRAFGERRALYSNDGLRSVLEETFEDLRLGDLKSDVLIPALKTGEGPWETTWFTRQEHGNERVVDVALATSAAPFYLPQVRGYVDGGVVANDPSLFALIRGVKQLGSGDLANLAGALNGAVTMLTLGSGRLREKKGILSVFADGLAAPLGGVVSFLGDGHHELDPELPESIPLDGGAREGEDVLEENLEELLAIAQGTDLEETLQWLEWNGWEP